MVKEGKTSRISKEELNQSLIDNFIQLQKVLTNLSVKFDELSGNISKLLQLFEISAKTFVEKGSSIGTAGVDKDFIEKINLLLDQNRIISKGIMLIEEKLREKENPVLPSQKYPPAPQFNRFPGNQQQKF